MIRSICTPEVSIVRSKPLGTSYMIAWLTTVQTISHLSVMHLCVLLHRDTRSEAHALLQFKYDPVCAGLTTTNRSTTTEHLPSTPLRINI